MSGFDKFVFCLFERAISTLVCCFLFRSIAATRPNRRLTIPEVAVTARKIGKGIERVEKPPHDS